MRDLAIFFIQLFATCLSADGQAIEHRICPQAAALFASDRLQFIDGETWLDGAKLDEPVQFNGAT